MMIRTPLQNLFVLVFCTFAPICGLFAQVPGSNSDVSSTTDQLDSFISIEEFSIRPPKGYRFIERSGPGGSKAYGWMGDKRSDGTHAQLLVATYSPGEAIIPNDLEPAFLSRMESMRTGREQWKQTKLELGTINGFRYVRTRWEGYDVAIKIKLFGFNYMMFSGDKVIQLSSQDVEPHWKEALALAELAALTFKKT